MVKLVRSVGSDWKVRYSAVHVFERRPIPRWPVGVIAGTLLVLQGIGIAVKIYGLNRKPQPEVAQLPQVMAIQPAVNPSGVAAQVKPPPGVPAEEKEKMRMTFDPVGPEVRNPEARRAEPPRPIIWRRKYTNPEKLAEQLLLVPEVGLDLNTLEKVFKTGSPNGPHRVPELLVRDDSLTGLPVRMGLDCHLSTEAAENLQVLSRKLRVYLSESVPKDRIDTPPDAAVLRQRMLTGADGARGDWQRAEAVPALVQVLQAEDKSLRLLLVELLSGMKVREASAALAQRAIFDLSYEVREAAVKALADRPHDDYRDILIDRLRYPWPTFADHAAEALVALKDRDSLGALVEMLDRPDPLSPYVKGTQPGQVVVQEVVRSNHLKNCLLCHAQSYKQNEPVRGLVPDPKKMLTPSFTSAYYESNIGIFVRADITYLKQDFSVPQYVPAEKPSQWPATQRYDYFVRTRPATDREIEAAKGKKATAGYPQRDSVLFALRELIGRDAGEKADDWRPVVAKMRRRSELAGPE
jgi:hypothetical protein